MLIAIKSRILPLFQCTESVSLLVLRYGFLCNPNSISTPYNQSRNPIINFGGQKESCE